MSQQKTPWEQAMDAMREDEEMRAGSDGTLLQKEHRDDAETLRQIAIGIAFEHTPKPDLFA